MKTDVFLGFVHDYASPDQEYIVGILDGEFGWHKEVGVGFSECGPLPHRAVKESVSVSAA